LSACLATSNFKLSFRDPCQEPPESLLPKCECLRIARSQKKLACKAAAQPHLLMALLAQRQKILGLLACLATSKFQRIFGGPCRSSPAALLPKCECLQIARRQKGIACKAVAQPHLPMVLLAQRHRDWGCFLVLPPQASNVALAVRAEDLRQPCSQSANVCRDLASVKASLQSCCSASSAHRTARTGTETGVACLSCHFNLQT